jgi:membrane protein required for colicin V production
VGFVRGAVREIITVVGFIIAVAIAIFGLRVSGPIARHVVHPVLLANGVAILVVFALVYVLLRVLGAALTRKVEKAQTLSGVDRAIGVGFGLLRALVLLGVFYLMFNLWTPPERVPPWIKNAAAYPLSAASGHVLMALAPQGAAVANKVGPALEKAIKEGSADKAKAPPAGQGEGYDDASRHNVDDLVEKNR